MIVVVIDAVLGACALAGLVWLAVQLWDNKIRPQDSWGDWAIALMITVALVGKLIQWCTPWL